MHRAAVSNGFSLVEVLVALFVLAVGVTAAASMQLTALRTAQQSSHQTIAVQMAAEMADTLRAHRALRRFSDPTGLADKADPYLQLDYRAPVTAGPTSERTASSDVAASEIPASCYAQACDASDWPRAEIAQWTRRLARALPDARARICRDAVLQDATSTTYSWDCVAKAADDTGDSPLPIVVKIGWHQPSIGNDGAAAAGMDEVPPRLVLAVAGV